MIPPGIIWGIKMPKPLLLQRKSGLYVRFFVPVDLQARLGSRYLVRSLNGQRADVARLAVASLGYALGYVFRQLRNEPMANPKDLLQIALKGAQAGRDYTIDLPNGARITTDGTEEDHQRASELAVKLSGVTSSPSSTLPAGLLSARIETFLSQMKSEGKSATNLLDTTFSLALFLDLVGDKELSSVNTDDLDKFLFALALWPSNASKKEQYQGLNAIEIVEKSKVTKDKKLAPRTKEKHLDRLRVFFGSCVKRRLLDNNPCDGLRVTSKSQDEEQSRQPFSNEELKILFSPQIFNQPHKFWGPILGLYTGARVNELAQLHLEDVEEIAGVWGVHFRRKIKNRSSLRFVPLRQELIRLGFLEYVSEVKASGFKHVFPGIAWGTNGPGDSIGDWFNRSFLRKTCNILDPSKTFHSFRHTFSTLAERSGLTDQRIAQLTGHSSGSSVLRRHYIQTATLAQRAKDIDSIQFPVLELNPRPKNFWKPWFKRVKVIEARDARQDKNR
jgi:integrase